VFLHSHGDKAEVLGFDQHCVAEGTIDLVMVYVRDMACRGADGKGEMSVSVCKDQLEGSEMVSESKPRLC
jgi:hypothetical protein